MRIVIVGGVAGGMSAATRLRRLNENAEIIVLEKGPYVSFANCGLPYYVGQEIDDRKSLIVQTPERLSERFRLDVRPNHEALEIHPDQKEVVVQSKEEKYTLTYDKLILSPGSKPFIPPIKGIEDAKNSFVLRTVPDVDHITDFITKNAVKKAVVIGAGFIGLEMAENLVKRGLEVTVIEKAPQVLPPLDEEMAAFIAQELKKNGIRVLLNQSAQAFYKEGRVIELEDGEQIESDLTLLSVGVRPVNELAMGAGVKLGMRGGIEVDAHYETSVRDIYAVGDAIIVKNPITQEDAMIALASPANRQGRQVADHISGVQRKNRGSIGTSIVRVFDLVAASTGLNERQVKAQGLDYKVVHTLSSSHASYYPGSTDIFLKLLFNPKTKEIYGAQAVGKEGVDKRIDVLATAIKAKLTVEDLPELELTYAPPFGSAKDPVNMIGYAALNLIEGLSENIQWYELNEYLAEGYRLLDVRTKEEVSEGHIQGSYHIPVDELRERIDELDPRVPLIVHCKSGQRSYIAERILKQMGYRVKNLDGSFVLYSTIKPEEVVIS